MKEPPAWALLLALLWYLSGIVLAVGFWRTVAAVFFFPYALYLVVERLLQLGGVL